MSRIGKLSAELVHQMALVRDLRGAMRRGDDVDALVARDSAAFQAAYRGDADALVCALRGGIEIEAAAKSLEMAAGHADPECVLLILSEWGERFHGMHIEWAVRRATERGNAETLRALLPYWPANDFGRADRARRTKDEACKALLLQAHAQEVAA